MTKYISTIAVIFILFLLPACATDNHLSNTQVDTSSLTSDTLIVEFDYAKQSGHASNQFAVWIEDTNGNLVKTLYATRFTVNGGYQNRPDSLLTWVDKSGLPSMEKDQIDTITGATPKAGTLSYAWDLTNTNGEALPHGEYLIFVEGSLRWKNHVLYSANIVIGDTPITVSANAEYVYEATDEQAALSADSPENSMIENVTVRFIPVT